jgi:hypothetical protein
MYILVSNGYCADERQVLNVGAMLMYNDYFIVQKLLLNVGNQAF